MTERKLLPRPALVGAIALVSACVAKAEGAFDPAREVVLQAEARAFEPTNPAISMAHAYGNRAERA